MIDLFEKCQKQEVIHLPLDTFMSFIQNEAPHVKLLQRDQMQTIYDYWKKKRDAGKNRPLL